MSRIQRIETHVGIERTDRSRGVTAQGQKTSDRVMSLRETRCQSDAAPRLGKTSVYLSIETQSNREDIVALWLCFVQLDRPLRDFQTDLERLLRDFGPAIDVIVHMSEADKRMRCRKIRIDRDCTFEQAACLNVPAPCIKPRPLAPPQVEIVSLLVNCVPSHQPFFLP